MLDALRQYSGPVRRVRRPATAVQVAARGVLAACAISDNQVARFAFRSIPAGVLAAGIRGQTLRSPETLTEAIKAALEEVSPDSQSVTLILPDLMIKAFLLEFDALPDSPTHMEAVLRLRIRKLAPFDVDKAHLDYQALAKNGSSQRVLAVAIPHSVLREYEASVLSAGFEPSAVLPAGLAALEANHYSGYRLIVSLGDNCLTTFIASQQDICLYRNHELSDDPHLRHAEIQRDIEVAAAFYEDSIQSKPQDILLAGANLMDCFSSLGAVVTTPFVELAPWPQGSDPAISQHFSFASVVGALAGSR